MDHLYFYHWSYSEIEVRPVSYIQKVDFKPAGLWFDVGGEWRRFCYDQFEDDKDWQERVRWRHRLEIDLSEVLILDEVHNNVIDFSEEYGMEPWPDLDLNFRAWGFGQPFIDWPRVAKKWKGIVIPEYYRHFRFEHVWYNLWDVPGGCVWDTDIVRCAAVKEVLAHGKRNL